MRKRSFWSLGFTTACIVGITAAFTLSGTGCISVSKTVNTKCGAKKCAGKCPKPCKNPDGSTKCPLDCKKPCCAKGAKGASAAPVNKNCPISGKPVTPGVTTVSAGKTVGLCCKGCVGKWDLLTQADKDAKLAGAM